jgi:N-hydroxyarylamine O-acetyltransferase
LVGGRPADRVNGLDRRAEPFSSRFVSISLTAGDRLGMGDAMSNEFRLDDYLKRIGFNGTTEPDLATLAAVHAAHVDAIPFEGFDPLLGRPVKLDLASVQQKLVDGRRGGYCFEQNTLLKTALETIGFKVTGLGGRVRWMSPPDSPLGPREHMLLKVDLPDGAYLADVGFGACLIDAPLRLETGVEQRTAMGTYLLSEADGLFSLSAKQPGGWRTMYVFNLEPQIPSDYELGNWFTSTSPLTPFTSLLIMERLGADKRYKLINSRFIVEARDGEVAEERLLDSAEALGRVLDETFNVAPPAPVEEVFARIG